MHILEREMLLNETVDKVWNFMATPLNLNELTPPDLDFKIISDLPETMSNGLLITYEIRIPVFGPHRWLTEIKHIQDGVSFVDEQRIGPYKFWYHQHIIEPVGETTTRMIDRVTYQLPLGIFGEFVHHFWVSKMLEEIFAYRTTRLNEIFG